MFVTLKHWMNAWSKTTASAKRQKLLHMTGLGLENLEERLVMSSSGGSSLQAIIQGLPPSDHINEGTTANVTAAVSGATGATQYSWSLFNSGTSIATSNQPTFRFTPMAPGNYNLTLGVTDSSGASTQSNQAVVVDAGGLQQGGFETPSVGLGTYAYQYTPSGSAWSFGISSGVSGNNSGFTAGNPNAPEGTQIAFLQAAGSFSQTASLDAGTYTLNFEAAQRGNWQSSSQTFQVQVDGTVVGTFKPTGTSYAAYATNAFTVTAGAHAITFVGLNPNGGDNTAFVDQVQLNTLPTTTGTGLQQGGFETPSVGTGTYAYQYDPSGAAWTFTGNAGVSGNNSGFTSNNPSAPEGTQVAFLQSTSSFSQTASLDAGTYTLNFEAAQRGNWQSSSQTFQVQVDGTVVGTFKPSGTSYAAYATNVFTVTAGTHAITFVGLNPNGGDNTAFVDQVQLNAIPTGTGLQQGGFETPSVGTGTLAYQYDPSGAAWTFTGNAGVSGNNSGFTLGNSSAPEGMQVAFLQSTGSFSQTASLNAGTYTLNFEAAQRGNWQSSSQTFQVQVDGTVVGTFNPTGTSYAAYATNAFTVSAGAHAITFVGLNPNGGDNTAFVDQVQLNAVTSAPAPTVTGVTPPNGATDLVLGTSVIVTFAGAVDSTTVNSTTVQLLGPSSTLVPATVSFNSTTDTATLTPTSALATDTTYTLMVYGGGSSGAVVKNTSGTALAATFTSTFTTDAPPAAHAGPNESGNEGSAITFAGSETGGVGALTYAWTFGDGGTASGSLTPSHVYQQAGTYTATLTVTDSLGQTSQSSDVVTVALVAPTVTIGGPYSGTAGTAIGFSGSATDPSTYDTQAGFTYSWTFGDGTSATTATASHSYAAAGTYTVTLSATDKEGSKGTASTTVVVAATVPPPAPVANAGPNESAPEGSTVTFAGSETGGSGTLSYSWTFGDGGTASGSLTPSHVYQQAGTYTATLTVTDGLGRTSSSNDVVTAGLVAPTVTIGGPYSGTAGTAISFSGSATDPSTYDTQAGFTYSWNFGDGTSATTATASHTYAAVSTYTVTLTATDKEGATTTATTTATVSAATQATAVILGDSGSGFTLTGPGWTGYSGGYDGESYDYTFAAPGAASASWQASGVTPGSYLVQATWSASANHTGAAAYSIYDGSTLVATVTVNQGASPVGPVIGGVPFQTLASVPLTSGTVRVVLVNQSSSGAIIADAVRIAPVGISPTATFSGPSSVNAGTTNATVTFSNPSHGSGGYTYSYDFNDSGTFEITGSTNATVTIPEAYVDNGPSTVVVHGRITDSIGDYTDYTTSITVNDVAPTASIILPSSRVVGTALTFSASVTDPSTADNNTGYTYSWNFGDGTSPSVGVTPSHTYYNPGVYTIALTVTDKSGSVGTASATMTVVSAGYITTPYLNIPDFGANPTIVSVQSGNWSNPAIWSLDRVPQAGDIVDINLGTTVTYNVNDTTDSAPLNTVEVKSGATLTFSTTTSTQMNVVNLMVLQGGELDIGTQANPIPANITATVVWVNQAINTTFDPEQYGNGLIVLGTINTYGAVKVPYVTLSQNANAGATVLHLASPATGWQVGDKLQLPDTRQLDPSDGGSNYTSEAESMTIQSISADGLTITLTAPLQYSHLGAYNAAGVLKYLPQVVNMTRNVSIHSQSATGTRGYALFTDHANVSINYTSFGGMGRTTDAEFLNSSFAQFFDNTTFDSSGNVTHVGTDEENRNAITFLDLVGPSSPQADGYQFTFNGNVVTCPLTPMPFIWGINVVNSYYGLIQNNDVVNWAGAGVMVDYVSSYNNFTGNFVMRINGTGGRGSSDMGFGGDGFWFGNANNYVTNNIVSDLADGIGQYGYGFEFYSEGDPGGWIEYQTIAAYQGADPSQPGQSQSVDMNSIPLLEFANNEVYGAAPIGMSYWFINYDPNINPTPLADGGVIQNFVCWNLWSTGIYGYQASNITVNGFVELGNAAELAADTGNYGMQFQDYFVGGMVIENADIENLPVGIRAPVLNGGTFTVENSYLADQAGFEIDALWTVNYSATAVPSRMVVIDNVQFAAPGGGGSFTAIGMNWYTQNALVTAACPVTQLDQVLVYNYDGVSGDNFQVFYMQQAANFIVPQTILNSDGTPKVMGAPVAGLTNAQAWTLYGVAVAGAVAPSDATTMSNIDGLVAPI